MSGEATIPARCTRSINGLLPVQEPLDATCNAFQIQGRNYLGDI